MTVGFHAPMPPARTGVADYAAALLPALRRHGSVEVAPSRADVDLYHLGNNPLHREIYRRAVERPGVAVLHEAVLQHFFLGWLDEDAYVEEFVYNYGEWHREQSREMWRGRSGSLSRQYFGYPMVKRIAERSRAVVVHNEAAAAIVRRHAPGAAVMVIPHLWAAPDVPQPADVLRFRARLGVAPGAFLFGIFGYLRESKRVMQVLRAFAAVRRALPHTMLLVAGEFVSTDLERAAAPMLAGPGVLRLPRLSLRGLGLAAEAVDACVNLRYPSAGETSGISIRLMGAGKPVLVTGGPENSCYPETACLRVEAGAAEHTSLWHHMVLLASVSGLGRGIGRRGAGHIASHHDSKSVAALYWKTLCEYCS